MWVKNLIVLASMTLGYVNSSYDQITSLSAQYAGVTSDLAQLFHTGCVILVSTEQRATSNKITQTSRSLSKIAITTSLIKLEKLSEMMIMLQRQVNRPLYLLTGNDKTREQLQRMRKVSSYPRWLLFLDQSIDQFFKNVDVPFDCEIIVAKPGLKTVELTEVYRVVEGQALITRHYGIWDPVTRLKVDTRSLYERRNNLNGLVLNAGAIEYLPMMGIKRDSLGKAVVLEEFFGTVWHLLEKRTNMTTRLFESPDKTFGTQLENGSWNGMIRMILDEKIQVAIGEFTMSTKRIQVVDWLMPLMTTRCRMYIRMPDTLNLQWNNFLRPFTSALWFGILCAILLLSMALTASCYLGDQDDSKSQRSLTDRLIESVLNVFGLYCQQGPHVTPTSTSSRSLLLLAGMTSAVLLAAYSGALTSFLTIQRIELPFTTIQGFIHDGSYQLTTSEEAINLYFDKERNNIFYDIYNKFILHRSGTDTTILTKVEGMQRICDGDKSARFATAIFDRDFFKRLTCTIVAIPDDLFVEVISVVVSKNSPYRGLLNHNLLALHNTGVLKRIYLTVLPKPLTNTDGNDFPKVNILQVLPIITILVVGIIISIASIVIEILVQKY